jgi:hypothetical protein
VVALAAAVTVLLGLAGNLTTGSVWVPDSMRSWVWAATGTLAIASVLIEVVRNLAPSGGPLLHLDDGADQLAQLVQTQWTIEEERRMAQDPSVVPVRWHPVSPADGRSVGDQITSEPGGTDGELELMIPGFFAADRRRLSTTASSQPAVGGFMPRAYCAPRLSAVPAKPPAVHVRGELAQVVALIVGTLLVMPHGGGGPGSAGRRCRNRARGRTSPFLPGGKPWRGSDRE